MSPVPPPVPFACTPVPSGFGAVCKGWIREPSMMKNEMRTDRSSCKLEFFVDFFLAIQNLAYATSPCDLGQDQEFWGGKLIPSLIVSPKGPYAPKKSFHSEVVGKTPIIGLNWR